MQYFKWYVIGSVIKQTIQGPDLVPGFGADLGPDLVPRFGADSGPDLVRRFRADLVLDFVPIFTVLEKFEF